MRSICIRIIPLGFILALLLLIPFVFFRFSFVLLYFPSSVTLSTHTPCDLDPENRQVLPNWENGHPVFLKSRNPLRHQLPLPLCRRNEATLPPPRTARAPSPKTRQSPSSDSLADLAAVRRSLGMKASSTMKTAARKSPKYAASTTGLDPTMSRPLKRTRTRTTATIDATRRKTREMRTRRSRRNNHPPP